MAAHVSGPRAEFERAARHASKCSAAELTNALHSMQLLLHVLGLSSASSCPVSVEDAVVSCGLAVTGSSCHSPGSIHGALRASLHHQAPCLLLIHDVKASMGLPPALALTNLPHKLSLACAPLGPWHLYLGAAGGSGCSAKPNLLLAHDQHLLQLDQAAVPTAPPSLAASPAQDPRTPALGPHAHDPRARGETATPPPVAGQNAPGDTSSNTSSTSYQESGGSGGSQQGRTGASGGAASSQSSGGGSDGASPQRPGRPPPSPPGPADRLLVSDKCVVCLMPITTEETRAHMDGCRHVNMHFSCAEAWAEHNNSCPVCKASFNTLREVQVSQPEAAGLSSLGTAPPAPTLASCKVLRSLPVRDAQPQRHGDSDTGGFPTDMLDPLEAFRCYECGTGEREDLLLICDGCDEMAAHTYCVGLGMHVPEGDWLCEGCQAIQESQATSRRLARRARRPAPPPRLALGPRRLQSARNDRPRLLATGMRRQNASERMARRQRLEDMACPGFSDDSYEETSDTELPAHAALQTLLAQRRERQRAEAAARATQRSRITDMLRRAPSAAVALPPIFRPRGGGSPGIPPPRPELEHRQSTPAPAPQGSPALSQDTPALGREAPARQRRRARKRTLKVSDQLRRRLSKAPRT